MAIIITIQVNTWFKISALIMLAIAGKIKLFIFCQSRRHVNVSVVKISMENYTKLRIIGTGSFGTVWLIRTKERRRNYVLKEISLSLVEERQRGFILNEVKVLSQLRHMNIIRYKEAFFSNGFLCISMEYANEGLCHECSIVQPTV